MAMASAKTRGSPGTESTMAGRRPARLLLAATAGRAPIPMLRARSKPTDDGRLGIIPETALCVAYAYAKAAEITERVFSVKNGMDPENVQPINPEELQQRFDEKFPGVPSADCLTNHAGLHKVLHMGLILRSEGIQREKSGERYKAADVSSIPHDDFEQICQSIAEGIPLVATYHTGKKKSHLPYCKIYKSPPLSRFAAKKAARKGHAVVVIGAGRKKGKRFLYFMNSWGKRFCPRKNKKGKIVTGGIGKLRMEDLTKNVIRLSHPNETGGERSLQDQTGLDISRLNYILMTARINQSRVERLLQLREEDNAGQIRADILDDGVFYDDEGGPQTCCAMSQGRQAILGSWLRPRGTLCLLKQWQVQPPLYYQQQSWLAVPPTHAQDLLCSHGPGMQGPMSSKLILQEAHGSEAVLVHGGKELLKAYPAVPAEHLAVPKKKESGRDLLKPGRRLLQKWRVRFTRGASGA